jgi:hypothetical protein
MRTRGFPVLVEVAGDRTNAGFCAPLTEKPVFIALRLRELGWDPYRVSFDPCASAWIGLSFHSNEDTGGRAIKKTPEPQPAGFRSKQGKIAPVIAIMIASLLGIVLSTRNVHAFEPTRRLAQQCEALVKGAQGNGPDIFIPRTKDTLQCWGYMQAMQDLSVLTDEQGQRMMGACPAEETTLLQFTRVFVAYARSHSDQLDTDAALAVIKSLQDAFPCPDTDMSSR